MNYVAIRNGTHTHNGRSVCLRGIYILGARRVYSPDHPHDYGQFLLPRYNLDSTLYTVELHLEFLDDADFRYRLFRTADEAMSYLLDPHYRYTSAPYRAHRASDASGPDGDFRRARLGHRVEPETGHITRAVSRDRSLDIDGVGVGDSQGSISANRLRQQRDRATRDNAFPPEAYIAGTRAQQPRIRAATARICASAARHNPPADEFAISNDPTFSPARVLSQLPLSRSQADFVHDLWAAAETREVDNLTSSGAISQVDPPRTATSHIEPRHLPSSAPPADFFTRAPSITGYTRSSEPCQREDPQPCQPTRHERLRAEAISAEQRQPPPSPSLQSSNFFWRFCTCNYAAFDGICLAHRLLYADPDQPNTPASVEHVRRNRRAIRRAIARQQRAPIFCRQAGTDHGSGGSSSQ